MFKNAGEWSVLNASINRTVVVRLKSGKVYVGDLLSSDHIFIVLTHVHIAKELDFTNRMVSPYSFYKIIIPLSEIMEIEEIDQGTDQSENESIN